MDFTSHIRTGVPVAVGWLLTRAGEQWGGSWSEVDGEALTTAVTVIVIAVYYTIARELEKRWPSAGWLLGSPKQPTYGP